MLSGEAATTNFICGFNLFCLKIKIGFNWKIISIFFKESRMEIAIIFGMKQISDMKKDVCINQGGSVGYWVQVIGGGQNIAYATIGTI